VTPTPLRCDMSFLTLRMSRTVPTVPLPPMGIEYVNYYRWGGFRLLYIAYFNKFYLPSWSPYSQFLPLMTLAPGYIPKDLIAKLEKRPWTSTLHKYNCNFKTTSATTHTVFKIIFIICYYSSRQIISADKR
jgi:hypothetical protein